VLLISGIKMRYRLNIALNFISTVSWAVAAVFFAQFTSACTALGGGIVTECSLGIGFVVGCVLFAVNFVLNLVVGKGLKKQLNEQPSMEEFIERYPHDITDDAHFYQDGQVVCDEELQREVQLEQTRKKLRRQRKQECFPIVNRGMCWYNDLSDEQKEELQNWYHAWLDVTETLEVPQAPSWLSIEEVDLNGRYYHL
jgi:hypothetical protein